MRGLLVCLTLCMPLHPVLAQIALPGATTPSAIGSVVNPSAPRKIRRLGVRPSAGAVAPPEAGLGGKTFYLNGGKSEIGFSPRDKTVDLSKLVFEGTKISNARDACEVEVQGMPLGLSPLGKVHGLNRFAVPLPVCPMSFDVLDDAILMKADAAKCSFSEADCEVAPDGLWGPAPGAIGPEQVKTLERERRAADSEMRGAYKGIVSATKDRTLVRSLARDQAGFSSHREEVCRDYAGESRHGFCASRLTQGRAAELQTAYVAAAAEKEKRRKR